MHPPESIAVIGGGVIGAFVAYHLARKGRQVTIIEKGGFGRGSSWGNCGIIIPSHLLPLNSVGNIVDGLRWTLKKDAPFYVRPRLDPALASWLAGFALRCTPAARRRSAMALAAVLDGAPAAFAEIVEREKIRCGWRPEGAIFLFQTAAGLDGRAAADAETKRYGKGCTPLPLGALREMEPAAAPSLAGAWMDEDAAHLMPDALMSEMKQVLEGQGVSVIEDTAFVRFDTEKGRAAAALTSAGKVGADAFVVATGAWTPLLSAALGVRLPIQPGKGYSVTLEGTERPPSHPCFFEEAHSVVTPRPNGMKLGGTMEFSGYDDRLNPIRIGALFRAARRYLDVGNFGRKIEEWCGWRPMTTDGVPIVDRLPRMENVVVAAGHNMLGLSLAPVTAKMVAAMLLGEKPPVDPAPYRLARFRKRFIS